MTSHPHNPASRRWHATHLPLVGLVSLAVLVGACLRTDFATPGGTAGTETETDTSTTAVDTDASTTDDSTSRPGIMTTTVAASTSGVSDSADTTTDVPDTTTDDASTEPVEPACGNGIVEPGEACDDGNDDDDDGCSHCAFDRIIFVTSESYQGHKLEGLTGADARCRMLGAIAGLPKEYSFRAWLSTADDSAASRMLHSPGRYVRTDGTVLAYGWDELTSGMLRARIDRDEHGMFNPQTYVWTGTLANGEPALDADFCDNWNADAALFQMAAEGQTVEQDGRWSFSGYGPCAQGLPLYCVEN